MKLASTRADVIRLVIASSCALVLGLMSGTPSEAQTRIRIGTQPSLGMLPIKYGIEKGLFKAQGLDVELVTIQPGPPIISALMASEIDAGWIASIPTILARANKVPVKLFANIVQERLPDHPATWFVTAKTSGVGSMADLRGKTVMINANGGACELAIREHLAAAGLSWSDVKRVIVPFPQMQAALELGNADLACTIDIFYEAMRRSDKIREKPVAIGLLPTTSRPMFANGLAATDAWLAKNKDAVGKFVEAYNTAIERLSKDKEEQLRLATTYAGIPAGLASQMQLIMYRPEAKVTPEALQPYIEALLKSGMLKQKLPAEEIVAKY